MSSQFWLLMRHEWRVLTGSTIVTVTVVVFVTAVLLASVLGASRANRDRQSVLRFEARTAALLIEGRRVAGTTALDSAAVPLRGHLHPDTVANERGLLAMVPVPPLSAFAVGQSDVYPSYLRVTARSLDALVTGDQIEHPLAVATGQLDLAFVVLFLYPLLLLAVSFDLTASERDNGMLRMVLSHPVGMRTLVGARLLVRLLLLSLPLVVIPAATLLLTAPVGVDAFAPLLLWTAVVLCYGLVWGGIALLVNAGGASAPTNALRLAGVWLVFAVVGPATVNLLIALSYPMPSRVESAVQARAATQDATVQGSQQLGQFLQDHPTTAEVGREGLQQYALLQAARDREVAGKLQAVNAGFEQQLMRQRGAAAWLALSSPTMIAQLALLDAAGTSSERFEHFRGEAEVFQSRWQAFFEPRVLAVSPLTVADYDGIPSFAPGDEPRRTAALRVLPRLALLAGAASVLLWWGLRRYRTYDA